MRGNGFNFGRTVDGWVSIGPEGTAYAVAFSVNQMTDATAILAATSTNGGRTWANTRVIKVDRGPTFSNDKPSVTADPTKPVLRTSSEIGFGKTHQGN